MGTIGAIAIFQAATAAEAGVAMAGQGLSPVDAALLEAALPDTVLLDDAALAEAQWRMGQLKLGGWKITEGNARFFSGSPALLRAAVSQTLATDGSSAEGVTFSGTTSAVRTPRFPIDAEDPINKIRLGIARHFGKLYLNAVIVEPAVPLPPGFLAAYEIDPALLRHPNGWLALLKATFFRVLDEVKVIRIYDIAPLASRGDIVHFHQPRFVPAYFLSSHIEEDHARVVFEIKPSKKDTRRAKREGMDAFRERMWQRFLIRLKRKLNAVERG